MKITTRMVWLTRQKALIEWETMIKKICLCSEVLQIQMKIQGQLLVNSRNRQMLNLYPLLQGKVTGKKLPIWWRTKIIKYLQRRIHHLLREKLPLKKMQWPKLVKKKKWFLNKSKMILKTQSLKSVPEPSVMQMMQEKKLTVSLNCKTLALLQMWSSLFIRGMINSLSIEKFKFLLLLCSFPLDMTVTLCF